MSDKKERPKAWTATTNGVRRWQIPFVWLEWTCEWTAYGCSKWAFIDVLEYGGKLAVVVTAIWYLLSANERRQAAEDQRTAKHYQAWQVINTAHGNAASGGRVEAMQNLNADGVRLVGVDVVGAYLPKLALTNATLAYGNFADAHFEDAVLTRSYCYKANFSNAYLHNVIFARAFLSEAQFPDAALRRANFTDAAMWEAQFDTAHLDFADLTDTVLVDANFNDATLTGAILRGADFTDSNLKGADLEGTDLKGASFARAYLRGVDLKSVTNWMGIASLKRANVFEIRNPPKGFMEWATNKMGAVSIPFGSYSEWRKWLENAVKP